MKIPLIDLSGEYRPIQSAIERSIHEIFESKHFVLGEHLSRFEEESAKYLGAKFAIGLASGTDALYLALVALGIGSGDEVITTPFSFFATASCIARTGARPVFVDIDPATFNLDPEKIKSKITRRTKAILPVHLFGLSCNMEAIMKIAAKHSLAVVEDAAQAFGAEFQGKKVGTIGTAGCFSFYPTKNLGAAGDGGMLTTSSKEMAEKIRLLRDHGAPKKYYHTLVGLNSRLDEIQAAILRIKLKRLDHWNQKRIGHAKHYQQGLQNLPLELPVTPENTKPIFHLYSVMAERRDALMSFLTKKEIGCGAYYPLPLHLQPCFKSLGYKKGDFPVSESTADKILSLPMYPELSVKSVDTVIEAVRGFFQ